MNFFKQYWQIATYEKYSYGCVRSYGVKTTYEEIMLTLITFGISNSPSSKFNSTGETKTNVDRCAKKDKGDFGTNLRMS